MFHIEKNGDYNAAVYDTVQATINVVAASEEYNFEIEGLDSGKTVSTTMSSQEVIIWTIVIIVLIILEIITGCIFGDGFGSGIVIRLLLCMLSSGSSSSSSKSKFGGGHFGGGGASR